MNSTDDWNRYIVNAGSNYWDKNIPDWVDAVPSMTNRREKAMLYHMTKDYPGQIERIVDAGCFGGASTIAFCRALKDSRQQLSSNMIVAFDLFETDHLSQKIYDQFGVNVTVGGTFLPQFMDVIHGYESIVSVVKGSILDFGWSGGSISILFLDVLKSQELNDHCIYNFMPHVPEGGIVFHQDYIHDPLPWIPMTMAALDDHFELIGWCKNTAVFICRVPVSKAKISETLKNLQSASLAEKEALFKKVMAPFPSGVPNINLSLSRIWMLAYHGDLDAARKEVEKFPEEEDWVAGKKGRLMATIERMQSSA